MTPATLAPQTANPTLPPKPILGPGAPPATPVIDAMFSHDEPRTGPGGTMAWSVDVHNPAWIGMKLRKLLNHAEPLGHFMAFVPELKPGPPRQQTWPSTIAYLDRLVMHRYAMLGVLAERGYPVRETGILQLPQEPSARGGPMAGAVCPECGNATVTRKDGCDFCTACGHVGSCG